MAIKYGKARLIKSEMEMIVEKNNDERERKRIHGIENYNDRVVNVNSQLKTKYQSMKSLEIVEKKYLDTLSHSIVKEKRAYKELEDIMQNSLKHQ